MTDGRPPKSKWHGFYELPAFIKATVSLGGTIAAALFFGLTLVLDDRYAPVNLVEQVNANRLQSERIVAQLEGFQGAWIRGELRRLQNARCHATTQRERQYLTVQIQELKQDYKDNLDHEPPPLTPCNELM